MTECKNRSQRGGQVEVFEKIKVKWPHEYVLAGNQKDCFSYDQLTVGQWMAGFCRSMGDEISQTKSWKLCKSTSFRYQIIPTISILCSCVAWNRVR